MALGYSQAELQEVRKKQRKISNETSQTTKYGRGTVAPMGYPFSMLVLYPHETLDRMHVT